jgi:hypothetical protein
VWCVKPLVLGALLTGSAAMAQQSFNGTFKGSFTSGGAGAFYYGLQDDLSVDLTGRPIELIVSVTQIPADPVFGDPAYYVGGAAGSIGGVAPVLKDFFGSVAGLFLGSGGSIDFTVTPSLFSMNLISDVESNNRTLTLTLTADRGPSGLTNWRGTSFYFVQDISTPVDVSSGGSFVIDDPQYTLTGFANVPEPATWAMMIAGFAMAGAAIRRRPLRLSSSGV